MGTVHWVSIYDVHNYKGPATIQKVMDFIENNKHTLENSTEWAKKQKSKDLFFDDPKSWWDIRRRRASNKLIPGGAVNITQCVEIPIKELEDQDRCDRIYDWLHDEENFSGDIYVSHYAKTVNIEVTKKWSVGGAFFSKSDKENTEEIKVPCMGLVFMEETDVLTFKLACM